MRFLGISILRLCGEHGDMLYRAYIGIIFPYSLLRTRTLRVQSFRD